MRIAIMFAVSIVGYSLIYRELGFTVSTGIFLINVGCSMDHVLSRYHKNVLGVR